MRNSGGYSFIELIMAILLMSIAIPGIVLMFTYVMTNSHDAEFVAISNFLASEQMEIILADKAGTGVGYGYDSITAGRYSSVNPGAPFGAWSRSVSVETQPPDDLGFDYKVITVTVSHPLVSTVVMTSFVLDHSGI